MDGRDNEEHIMYNMIDEGTGGYHYDGADDDGDDDGSQYLNLDEADGRDNYDEFFGVDDDGEDTGLCNAFMHRKSEEFSRKT